MFEIRFNPIAGEWVVVAAERMRRPVLPSDSCPFCPGVGHTPEDYDVFVYQNDYPSLSLNSPSEPWANPVEPSADGASSLYVSMPSYGACEVILYSPVHDANIYDLPDWHIDKLVQCWQDRTRELGSRRAIRYVFIFENRGEAVGVTIHHPHGQIYAFPFVPAKIKQEIEACRRYLAARSRCLMCGIVREELRGRKRIVAENDHFICIVPYFARFPFEAHVVARRHFGSILDLDEAERRAFGEIIQNLVRGLDNLFGFRAAYIMAVHQAPTDDGDYSAYHFHVEFYPAHADSKTLKHLSGTEVGIDVFVNPSDVEANAARLRRAINSS